MPTHLGDAPQGVCTSCGRTLIRKTSLLHKDRSNGIAVKRCRRFRYQATDVGHQKSSDYRSLIADPLNGESAPVAASQPRVALGSISSSRCQTTRAPTTGFCDEASKALELGFSRTSSGRRQRPAGKPSGGARRDRTDDLLLAKQALSQLSYGPVPAGIGRKVGVPTEAATAAKVGGPGKI
jgi:hypothetical protein